MSLELAIRAELAALDLEHGPFDVHAHTGADVDGTIRTSEEHLRDLEAVNGRSVIFPLCVRTGYEAENRRVLEECRGASGRLTPFGDEWVVAALRSAAAAALGRGAPAAAISYLRRALHEPPPKQDRPAASRELGVALLRADEPEGIEILRALRAAESDPVVRAELATELSISLSIRRPGGEGRGDDRGVPA